MRRIALALALASSTALVGRAEAGPVVPWADVVPGVVLVQGPPPPPPPSGLVPPPPSAPKVHVLVGTEARGPLDRRALEALVRSGELTPDTFVWISGMPEWTSARAVPETTAAIEAVPASERAISYYVAVDGTTTGPFGRTELVAQIAAGTLREDSFVFAAGMPDWQPAAVRDDLAGYFYPVAEPALAPNAASVADVEPVAELGPVVEPAPATEPAPVATLPSIGPAIGPVEDAIATAPIAAPQTTLVPAQDGTVAELAGRWESDRTFTLETYGPVEMTLTLTRNVDGTARLEGRGRVTSDQRIGVVIRGDLRWTATEPQGGRLSIQNHGDIEVLVRRPGVPSERIRVAEDVVSDFEVVDPDTLRDVGDGTVWTRR